ncbi:bifunctional riboflavin kinase/FAD synthetase [Methylovirgula sp. 4M-Z18]|uniref:bifunctional riboflavin kinase/FAD synthetase n=1 Tax=Methylovirgula sp. 4M-Z18 TaxID=2293567 RepID=UPI000E2F8179|nr:bifunctional riboflavin kinase/FAD synthetase [Methylovirgula sp. 4M-Z18]RFB76382.1 bifunctional riboflavin kinase/FAD synthetase [Methylovirgula sp. 4M-Z18]
MQHPSFIIAHDPAAPPLGLAGAVVAIGNFDGVHRGHAGVLARAKALAQKLGRPCAVLTFEPHPADYFAKRSVIFRLTTWQAKAEAFARLGLEGMVVLSFDADLAGLTAEHFVEDVLVKRLQVSAVVVGYDFHFGKARQGSPEFLQNAGVRYGFAVEVVAKIAQDAAGSLDAVSSTAIREALVAGDVAAAAQLLGHNWFIEGEVVHGQKLGRTLGIPTANIVLDPSSHLRHGIYAVRCTADDVTYNGVASFGRRPTVDNGPPLLEVFVFDFSGDLYGKEVEVDFVAWLRGEEKFDGLDALKAQMQRDVEKAREILGA